ncbi:MAG: tRNA epoxyqueuosine(34) reductase QueG [Bryobacteraceae bacterium]
MAINAEQVKLLARQCGFELAGIAAALPLSDYDRFEHWREAGLAGEMTYLTDRRGDLRQDPRHLFPDAKTIICVGKLYNTDQPYSVERPAHEVGWISRYAWGADYHDVLRRGLEQLRAKLEEVHGEPFSSRICVDTAPLLERSYAREAGLGWIGRNTCLINQGSGSWFFLGELLTSLELAPDSPPPDRCGTCTRCIEACPTAAIVPSEHGWRIDARTCISYLTIEKRGPVDTTLQAGIGDHLFGCDICQDVCPWNRKAPDTMDSAFERGASLPSLLELSEYSDEDFRREFRKSPVWRAKYRGFLRNVAIAMGNSRDPAMLDRLRELAAHPDASISAAAVQALAILSHGEVHSSEVDAISSCVPL